MTETLSSNFRIEQYLAEPLVAGEPDVAGPLAVFPLFGGEPRQRYISFAEGRAQGVKAHELEGHASVRDLVITNPADVGVLLYEGEEILGAQQNRTFDVSVLVAAGTQLRVPVSCVEAGRWDGGRHDEELHTSPQATYPELRRLKNLRAREQVASGMEPRADQAEVWAHIDAKSARHRVRSQTGAMHDVYEGRRSRLAELTGALRRRDGQLGALVAIGGRFTVLDFVSRADVFAALHGPLVQGYALDALEALDFPDAGTTPTGEAAGAFVRAVSGAGALPHPAIGLGRDLRLGAADVSGSALVHEDELIQLTAFPCEPGADSSQARAGRIRRPSRRRA